MFNIKKCKFCARRINFFVLYGYRNKQRLFLSTDWFLSAFAKVRKSTISLFMNKIILLAIETENSPSADYA
jgi:hypothetical protein